MAGKEGVNGQGDLSENQPQQEDDMVIAEMEEDEDMSEKAGIPIQTVFKDKVTGHQGVVEATNKPLLPYPH